MVDIVWSFSTFVGFIDIVSSTVDAIDTEIENNVINRLLLIFLFFQMNRVAVIRVKIVINIYDNTRYINIFTSSDQLIIRFTIIVI